MRLRSLQVRNFGCVEHAELSFGPGLNVLYGPNDLGKSTLVRAIRAALLLPASHREAQRFLPWHRDAAPDVTLVFDAPDEAGSGAAARTWKLRKSFGGRRALAELSWSNDGETFSLEQKGSGVDAKLRTMLGWGVPQARARGPRGFPGSFLATVLLGPQAVPGSVLGHSLDDDPSESGRERLTEALQALAQDPKFKEVLEQAQAKVDQAYTATGKPRRGKASPFATIKSRIDSLRSRLEDLQTRVHESDDVREQVLQLDRQRNEAVAALDEARAEHERVAAAFAQAQQRRVVAQRVEQAQQALDDAQQRLAEHKRWQEAVDRHVRDCPTAEAALVRAREAEQDVARTLAAADAAKQAAEEGGDAQARLERQELETRRLRLRAEVAQAHTTLKTLDDAIELQEKVEQAKEAVEAVALDEAAAKKSMATAEAAAREAEGEARRFDAGLRLRRWEQAQARVDAAQQELAEAERLQQRAQAQLDEVEKIEAEIDALDLPDAETIDAWRKLAQQRSLAEAKLGVGLSLVVTQAAQAVAVGPDDADATALAAGQSINAERSLRIEVGDGTVLAVEGGDPGSRAALAELRQRWSEQVQPVLERLGLDDLDALVARQRQAQAQRQDAQRQRQAAQATATLADTRRERAGALPELQRAAQVAEQALAGLDREALAEQIGPDDDETSLGQRKTHALARVDEARHRHSTARSELAALSSQRTARAEQHEALQAELTQALAGITGELADARDRAFDALAALEGEQESIDEDLAELDRRHEQRRATAEAAYREARTEADQAKVARAAAEDALTQRREALASAQGRLAELSEAVKRFDEGLLRAEVETQREALRALPEPEDDIDEDTVAEAERQMTQARRELAEVGAQLEQHRGALKQVGGAVAREDADRTREALEASTAAERDLELDFEAWRLLAQTLREAETAEGRHLGDALGEPVRERFSALTAGRYGDLSLGRDLRAQGLEVAGDLRDVGAFSEGVQDQLATILRLAVAENLGSALVMDDHLAQTDPSRVAWFRGLLDEVADRAQIVVLTCRPEDYLQPDERPADGEATRTATDVRAVDLTAVIRRA